jgi:plasmid stabilization system protein ParE
LLSAHRPTDHIKIWRVLHDKRDIPAWMNEDAAEGG